MSSRNARRVDVIQVRRSKVGIVVMQIVSDTKSDVQERDVGRSCRVLEDLANMRRKRLKM